MAQKIVQEILKEDEKKIERIVDDGMQCRTEESSCAASFLCVSKYRYSVCKIMYIASVILCLEDI